MRDVESEQGSRSSKATETTEKSGAEAKLSPPSGKQSTTQNSAAAPPLNLMRWNARPSPYTPDIRLDNEIKSGESTINPFQPCEPFPAAQYYVTRRNIPIIRQQRRKQFATEDGSTIDPFEPCEPFDIPGSRNQIASYRLVPGALSGFQHVCAGTCFVTGIQPWCPVHAISPGPGLAPAVNISLTRVPFF